MSVLITGATGFLGSRLVHRLLAQRSQEPIVILGRGTPDALRARLTTALDWLDSSVLPAAAMDRLRYHSADLTLPALGLTPRQQADIVRQVTTVWHSAALLALDDDPASLHEANVLGTRRVLELAELVPGARVMHVSSAYVSGRRSGHIMEDDLEEEADFHTAYEESKYTAERLVRHWAAENHRTVTVMRTGLLADDRPCPDGVPGQPLDVLARLLRTSLQDRANTFAATSPADATTGPNPAMVLNLQGDPEGALNLVQADYATQAMLRAAAAHQDPGVRTLHIIHPHDTTFLTFTRAFEAAYPGLTVRITPNVTALTELEERLHQEYGYLLAYSSHERSYDRTHLLACTTDLPDPPPVTLAYLTRAVAPPPATPATV